MKMTIKPMLFVFFLAISLISCNNEELFVEPAANVVVDDVPNDEPAPDDTATPVVNTSTPCDFNLNTVQPNSTVVINCSLNLGGQTVNLPSNVTIIYEGGEIINGTLNFSGGNIISGELLNSSLIVAGIKPQLKDPVFNFDPKRWGIVEGKVTDAVALNNKNILNDMFVKVKDFGVNTFKIDKMDAYFLVSKDQNVLPQSRRGDIFLPSDFNLVMTDNTHLRVQPNGYTVFSLMTVLDVSNVTITGGNLHGDRDEHSYVGFGGATGHGDSALLALYSAVNTTVDGVKMYNSTADGIIVLSLGFAFNPDYKPSNNVLIKNCVIDKSRRNNISIVNGHHIIVENSQILNAGVATAKSVGTLPRLGIDVEALRSRDANGNIILYELAKDIIIRNNIERGSDNGGFLVAIGEDVLLEGNDMENYIGYDIATGVKIRNNKFTATPNTKSAAIGAAGPGSTTTYNNEVSGNIITGYSTGITAYCYGAKIFNNTITDFDNAIFIKDMSNTNIYDNFFTSTRVGSRGIAAHIGTIKNCNIYRNKIDVTSYPVSFININLEVGQENNKVNVYDNTFISPRAPQISNSIGVILNNNN